MRKFWPDPEGYRKQQIDKRLPDDFDDLLEEEQQEIVSELEDLVASYDPAALREEIIELGKLMQLAQVLENREVESKLVRLRELIQQHGIFADPKSKLLIFTEHKDKLDELNGRLERRSAELRHEAECMLGDNPTRRAGLGVASPGTQVAANCADGARRGD